MKFLFIFSLSWLNYICRFIAVIHFCFRIAQSRRAAIKLSMNGILPHKMPEKEREDRLVMTLASPYFKNSIMQVADLF